jgi:hypothetical protein
MRSITSARRPGRPDLRGRIRSCRELDALNPASASASLFCKLSLELRQQGLLSLLLQIVTNRDSQRAKHAEGAISKIAESASCVFSIPVDSSTPSPLKLPILSRVARRGGFVREQAVCGGFARAYEWQSDTDLALRPICSATPGGRSSVRKARRTFKRAEPTALRSLSLMSSHKTFALRPPPRSDAGRVGGRLPRKDTTAPRPPWRTTLSGLPYNDGGPRNGMYRLELARIDPNNPPPAPRTLQPTHPELIEAWRCAE